MITGFDIELPPQITVVIPVYNRAGIIGDVLADLEAQTYRNFRVILVDNGSTDGTLAALQAWAEATPLHATVLTEPRRGAAAARQRGLDAVDTEWTLFFDSDDRMAPSHILLAQDAIENNPFADIIGWDVWHADEATGRKVRKPFAATDAQFHSLFHGTMATQRYCARTALFRRAGGWDSAVGVWDDIELGARLLAINHLTVKVENEPTVTVIQRADSLSRGERAANIAAIEPALTRIAATLGDKGPLWTALKRVILAARSADKTLLKNTLKDSSHKAMLRWAYHYTRLGGRGAARMLRPLL